MDAALWAGTLLPAGGAAAVTAGLAAFLLPVLVADEAGVRLLRLSIAGLPSRPPMVWLLAVTGILLALGAGAVWQALIPATAHPALAAAVGACAGVTPLLAWTDIVLHRLPDRIVLPLMGLVGALCALGGAWSALLAGAASLGAFLALSLLGGRGRGLAVGLGDVKFAFCVGAVVGLISPAAVVGAFLLANLTGLAEAAVRTLVRKEPLSSRFALGPHLLLGMWAAPVLAHLLR